LAETLLTRCQSEKSLSFYEAGSAPAHRGNPPGKRTPAIALNFWVNILKIKEMADLKELHKNPVIRFGMTLAISLPVGIIITLISAAVLRRKEFPPA
jgi:hypothetical protein